LQLPAPVGHSARKVEYPLGRTFRSACPLFCLVESGELASLHRLWVADLYGARQAFSQKQLSELPDGRLRYALKRPWGPQGARELVLDPTELLHRLALLLPKPYLNLTRYSGIVKAPTPR
jgi:hypothetical protein